MFSSGFIPHLNYIIKETLLVPVLALLILAAPVVLAFSRRPWPTKVALAGLLMPFLTLLVYPNNLPYSCVFILPPVVTAAAIVLQPLVARYGTAFVAIF